MRLLYHSDSRGDAPYFPSSFTTLEIPTTLPTWDEMLAWDGVTPDNLVECTLKEFKSDTMNVWTVHAEFEGNVYFSHFQQLIERLSSEHVEWLFLPDVARHLLKSPEKIPTRGFVRGERPGRAGSVTCESHG